MDSPTKDPAEAGAPQTVPSPSPSPPPPPPPKTNDPFGFYQIAEESRAKKKAIEAEEEQHADASSPSQNHGLPSPAVFGDPRFHRRNEQLGSAHGLPAYRRSVPPPPNLSLQNPYLPHSRENNNAFQSYQSRPNSSAGVFGPRSHAQFPQRTMPGRQGFYSQGYDAPSHMYNASRSPTHDYLPQNQPTWGSEARRQLYAPSPGMSMESGAIGESHGIIGNMGDENGREMGEYDMDNHDVGVGFNGHHQDALYRPRTPLQSGDSLFVSRYPVHPSSIPQASHKRQAMPRSYSDNGFVEESEQGEYSDSPDPTNYNLGLNGDSSPTPGYERKSRIDGFMPPRYPPWRNIGEGRKESRFSGSVQSPTRNKMPRAVPRSTVSDAVLLKKGLPVAKGKHCINRAYGVNDPENIEIVNLHDHHNMSWAEIAEKMNAKRVAQGKTQQLSITAIANRYCRNAPVLMGAAGMKFVPLAKRRKTAKGEEDVPRIDWTAENDVVLVEIYNAYEEARWETICREFQEETGIEVHPMEAARRYAAIR